MTRINKLVMHGFKSFANRTELVFGNEFNCILGPNGSGKSNVLDALCFVLGKAGSKGLRAEKSANLIYNGGKLKNPAKQGEVSIYFDNSAKTFPVDAAEIKVTRIITASGQSKYRINDEPRTRQQILDLLSIARIDPDGHNIILQGDVIGFTEMPTAERRMVIEDISGISLYEEKKHKALLELDKVDSKLKEADLILTERGTYLKELRKDRDQAMKYKEMNDKIKQHKASYLKIQIDKSEEQQQSLEKQAGGQKERLDKIASIIAKLREENSGLEAQLNEINSTIDKQSDTGHSDASKDVENLKILLAKNTTQIDHYKDELNKIKKRRQDLENELRGVGNRVEELKETKEQLIKSKEKQLSERERIAQKIKQFKEKHKLDELGTIEGDIVAIDESLEKLQQAVHQLREQQQELIRKKDAIAFQLNTIDEQIKKVAVIEKEHKQQIGELKKQREEFLQVTAKLNDALNDDSHMAKQISAIKLELAEKEPILAKVHAQHAAMQEQLLGDSATKSIIELKSRMDGIYGVVADLGKVSKKYAAALEAAAGPRIKSIVVETDKVAADCIDYLKRQRAGTATFLPLNKIQSPHIEADLKPLAKSAGCHGFAIDLVQFDSKFRKAFEYVFANTLVVDTIQTARTIGIGRAKMVTLDGDSAERSGVMKGGYRDQKRGLGFKEGDLLTELNDLEGEIAGLQKQMGALQNKRNEVDHLIDELRQKKAHLEGEIIVKEKQLHLDDKDIDAGRTQKDELQKRQKEIDAELDTAVSRISDTNKDIAQAKIKKQQMRDKISQLRNPLLLAELNSFDEMKTKLNEDIVRIDAEMRSVDEQIATIHDPEKEKAATILKQLDKEEEDFGEQVKKLVAENKETDKTLTEKQKQLDVFYEKFKQLLEKKKQFEDKMREHNSIIDEKKDESRDVEIKMNAVTIKLAEVKARLAGLNMEFEQYHGVDIVTNKNEDDLKKEISKFEKMQETIGSVNMRALEIYEDVEKEYNSLLEKKKTLEGEKESVTQLMQDIEGKKKDLFMKTYEIIRQKFITNFASLNKKGEADLELEDPETIFNGGVDIKVRITGNKFLDIRSLSGGEKTLTALAFIFAIQEHEPASFYILDEVDAALDKHNSEKLADLIDVYSKTAQYIVISHNDAMISKAKLLYGVSMNEHNVSKVVSLEV